MIILKPNARNIRSNLSNKREVHLASDKCAYQGHLFPGLLWQMPESLRPQRVSTIWRSGEGRWGRGCVLELSSRTLRARRRTQSQPGPAPSAVGALLR